MSRARKPKAGTAPLLGDGGLFMSIGGEVACAWHIPARGSDSFVQQQWAPLTQAEIDGAREQFDEVLACETCTARRKAVRQ